MGIKSEVFRTFDANTCNIALKESFKRPKERRCMPEESNTRQRAQKKLLRVTLPDGKVICHKNATMTYIETLAEIDSSDYAKIILENCHLPLLSTEVYSRYKKWMKPVKDGWYVNTQSDTDQKYMQLRSIAKQLGIKMEIEIGTDFITSDVKVKQKSKNRDKKLLIKFPDGEYIGEINPIDTFTQTIWRIGVDVITRKSFEYKGKPLITFSKQYNGQIQVDATRWLTIPPLTKEKYKMLRIIDSVLRLGLEISMI